MIGGKREYCARSAAEGKARHSKREIRPSGDRRAMSADEVTELNGQSL